MKKHSRKKSVNDIILPTSFVSMNARKIKVGLSQNCRLLCAFAVDVKKFSSFSWRNEFVRDWKLTTIFKIWAAFFLRHFPVRYDHEFHHSEYFHIFHIFLQKVKENLINFPCRHFFLWKLRIAQETFLLIKK